MMPVTVDIVEGTETGPVFYQVQHERDGRLWTSHQRFSTLLRMKNALQWKKAELPDIPFPPKQWPQLFMWQAPCSLALPSDEMEDRRSGLQRYLSALAELKSSWDSDTVTDVLCPADDDTVEASSTAEQRQSVGTVATTARETFASCSALPSSKSPPGTKDDSNATISSIEKAGAGAAEAPKAAVAASSATPSMSDDFSRVTIASSSSSPSSSPSPLPLDASNTRNKVAADTVKAAGAAGDNASMGSPASRRSEAETTAPPASASTFAERGAKLEVTAADPTSVAVAAAAASARAPREDSEGGAREREGASAVSVLTLSSATELSENDVEDKDATGDETTDEAEGQTQRASAAVVPSSPDLPSVVSPAANSATSTVVSTPADSAVSTANAATSVADEHQAGNVAVTDEAPVVDVATKGKDGGGTEDPTARKEAPAIPAIILSSAAMTEKDSRLTIAETAAADEGENTGGLPVQEKQKRRNSLLGRAKRTLSMKRKPGGDSGSGGAAGRVPPSLSAQDTSENSSHSSPITPGAAATPRTVSRMSSIRNKARSFKGRLSAGGGSGKGPLSLNSAKGKGGGFFSTSAASPKADGDAGAAAKASPVERKSSGAGGTAGKGEPSAPATVSPASVASPSLPSPSTDGELESIRINKNVFVAVGDKDSAGGTVAFSIPPSPGGE